MILNSNMTHMKPTLKELGQNHWHETCVFRKWNIFPSDSFGRLCFYVFCIYAKRSTLTMGRDSQCTKILVRYQLWDLCKFCFQLISGSWILWFMTILVEEKDVKRLFYPHNTTYEKYFPKNHCCNTIYLDCISTQQCHILNLRIGAMFRFTSSNQIHVLWWIISPTICCIVILAYIRYDIMIV